MPTVDPAQRFPVRFYLVAMIFIIFDIEIVFTYPWAVIYSRDLGKFGLIEMVVFAVTVEKLHSRDKEIARRQREGPGGDGGGPGGSGRPVTPEPEPAGELEPA